MERYYITATRGDDEFTLDITTNRDDAVRSARSHFEAMNDYDKKHNRIEIRAYTDDIESEGCTCFDYDTIEWR